MLTHKEEILLCNFEDDLNVSQDANYIQKLWSGEWEYLIKNNFFIQILQNYTGDDSVKHVFNNICIRDNHEEVFCTGIASLFCFVQVNFTGPALNNTLYDFLAEQVNDRNYKKYLSTESEEISVNVKHEELLLVAKCIFENCSLENSNINAWWYLRCIMIYQHLLDECSVELYTSVEEKLDQLLNWELTKRIKAKLFLEVSQFFLMYGKIHDSDKNICAVKDLLGLNFELTGELGRRTKHQQRDIAQIVLRIELGDEIERPPLKNTVVPNIIILDDDVRLDKIQYCNDPEVASLPALEQSILLTNVQFMKRAKPKDELLLEECQAFVSNLLQQNNPWAVRFVSLLLRCYLESHHKRTIERSLLQCESLIAYLDQKDPNPVDRVSLVWSTNFQPRWQMESHMANLMLNLGLVKAALELYLRLQMWEDVIVCYNIMQLRHKAQEVISDQLEKSPTVKLWCLLGDATDDVTCYQQAWEMSNYKSSRVQRHWGQFLFARKEYAECIPHLQKSLEMNSLQNMVWLRLGYAALEVEDWQLAAKAYRRYTFLEPGGFEAWNNLAKAYIKLGEKIRAHFSLQEALKYSFDNWKIWDNFMVVSAATEHYSDVIRAYHHILDLKEKHLDLEVLFMLAKHIITNITEEKSSIENHKTAPCHENLTSENGKPTSDEGVSNSETASPGSETTTAGDENPLSRKEDSGLGSENAALSWLLAKTRELFGRLTSIYPNESRLWEMYADLSPSAEIKAQRLYRAYRGLVQDDWSKNPEKCGLVLEICQRLGEASLEAGSRSSLSSSRLTLKAAVAAAKKQAWEQHADVLNQLEELLDKIMNAAT